MGLATTLYVGTDISEAMNRTRFYGPGGEEVGRGFESANDLPGTEGLALEAINRANRIGAGQLMWGLEATNLFWWHLGCFLTTNPGLLSRGLRLYTFNPRVVSKFKESYPDLGKGDWVDAMVIADRLRFGRLPRSATWTSATSLFNGSPGTASTWWIKWFGKSRSLWATST